jgi:hypothetical protein
MVLRNLRTAYNSSKIFGVYEKFGEANDGICYFEVDKNTNFNDTQLQNIVDNAPTIIPGTSYGSRGLRELTLDADENLFVSISFVPDPDPGSPGTIQVFSGKIVNGAFITCPNMPTSFNATHLAKIHTIFNNLPQGAGGLAIKLFEVHGAINIIGIEGHG